MQDSGHPPVGAGRAFSSLVARMDDAVLVLDSDQRIVTCNAAAARLYGAQDRESMLRLHPSELSPPRQPNGRASLAMADEMITLARDQGSHRFEWTARHADGTELPCEVLLTPFETEQGSYIHSIVRDISPRKRLERGVRHAARLQALARMAGGIAHDFNNLIAVIDGHAEFLQDELVPGSPLGEHVSEIRHAADRARSLVRDLLDFSRDRPLRLEPVDLNEVVRDSLRVLPALLGREMALEHDLAEDPLPIRGESDRLRQVILNLATNARDAAEGRGRFRLETRAVDRAELPSRLLDGLEGHAFAVLTALDDGPGMEPEVREHVFDPFYTTKPPGSGSGMGLTTLHATVERHGGRVVLDSEPGRGARFDVVLPLAEAPVTEA